VTALPGGPNHVYDVRAEGRRQGRPVLVDERPVGICVTIVDGIKKVLAFVYGKSNA